MMSGQVDRCLIEQKYLCRRDLFSQKCKTCIPCILSIHISVMRWICLIEITCGVKRDNVISHLNARDSFADGFDLCAR